MDSENIYKGFKIWVCTVDVSALWGLFDILLSFILNPLSHSIRPRMNRSPTNQTFHLSRFIEMWAHSFEFSSHDCFSLRLILSDNRTTHHLLSTNMKTCPCLMHMNQAFHPSGSIEMWAHSFKFSSCDHFSLWLILLDNRLSCYLLSITMQVCLCPTLWPIHNFLNCKIKAPDIVWLHSKSIPGLR